MKRAKMVRSMSKIREKECSNIGDSVFHLAATKMVVNKHFITYLSIGIRFLALVFYWWLRANVDNDVDIGVGVNEFYRLPNATNCYPQL